MISVTIPNLHDIILCDIVYGERYGGMGSFLTD